MRDVDWESIKAAYIVGDDSLKDIARRFNLSHSLVCKQSKKDGWVAAREAYRTRIAKAALDAAEEKDTAIFTTLLGSISKLVTQIDKGLDDDRQMYRHLVSETNSVGTITTVEREFDKVDWQAVRAAVQSLASATGVARDLLGIRSRQQEAEYQLQLQKLEILRAKAALGESDEDGTGIIFMPSVSEELSPPEEVTEDEEQQ